MDVPSKAPLTLGPSDVLKLTFSVVEGKKEGVHPHQTFVRFYDEATGEEGIQPVRVSASGKAKFELVSISSPSPLSLSFFLSKRSCSICDRTWPARPSLYHLRQPRTRCVSL